ncbi:MAG: hemerythrin domain-containing protein [Ilumatobacteraceae bacterium]
MNDPLRILKADHREVERLLKQLGETDEGRERQRLAREVQTKLTAHMEIEETIVYPPVSDEVGDEDREEAEVEHRLARDGLATMMSMLDQPGFGASVEMLLGGIKHHVEEEESQLLPELKDAMERDEWLAMGDAIAAAKEAAGLPVPTPTPRRSAKRSKRASGSKRTSESKARSKSTKKSTSSRAKSGGTTTRSTSKRSTAKRTTSSSKR